MASRRKPGGRGRKPAGGGSRPLTGLQRQRLQQAARAHAAGDLAWAESVYRALVAENVRQPELFNNLGLVCLQSGREAEAMTLLKQALAIAPRFPDARMHLATLYERQGRNEQAIKCYERLLAEYPRMHVARYLLGNLLKAEGRMQEARARYLEVLEQKPDYTQAHFTYSGLHRYARPDDPHLADMLALHGAGTLEAEGRIHLAFALSKAFEDLGDYERAFRYLEEGNGLRFRKYQYGIEGDLELFDNIIETFNESAIRSLGVPGEKSARPIFIVGMPRSGTTLVERILASHGEVYGAGELHQLYALGVERFMKVSGQVRFQPLDRYPPGAWASLGGEYVAQTAALGGDAARFTDKLPMNFMLLGLIRLALPNAKIVHCVRDPRATCLSIYKQNFSTENYRFAYDLRTIAQFHKLYQRLMDHWRRVFPGDIYDIEYEALTREPEREIRALLESCGLEFQEACLDFHRSRGTVKTASFSQVRQPMYDSSVELWKRYEAWLGPLFEELERVGR
jgi:tetratricopeptide (TPR) repeat protein